MPIVNFTIRVFTLLLTFTLGWYCKHVDITSAFLNGEIGRELFVQFRHNIPDCSITGTTYRLHKALYGLKQAPLLQYRKEQQELIHKLNYNCLTPDSAVFVKRDGTTICIVLAYVDESISISSNLRCLENDILIFLAIFEATVKSLNWYFGVHTTLLEEVMQLSRTAYINQALQTSSYQTAGHSRLLWQRVSTTSYIIERMIQ